MVIIWRGYGILVPVIYLAVTVPTLLVAEWVLGDAAFADAWWPGVVAGLLAGIAIWSFGSALDRRGFANDLFFIPSKYWAFPAVALGALMVIVVPVISVPGVSVPGISVPEVDEEETEETRPAEKPPIALEVEYPDAPDGSAPAPAGALELSEDLAVRREEGGTGVLLELEARGFGRDASSCHLVLDLTILDPSGTAVLEKNAILEHREQEPSGTATLRVPVDLPAAGEYEVWAILHDRISGTMASRRYRVRVGG